MILMTEKQFTRFMKKVDNGADACWHWTAAKSAGGYGRFTLWSHPTIAKYAHRLAYEYFIGPVPEGLDLDHLCRNRACVNPTHLEPVTRRENCRRGLIGVLITPAIREMFASHKRGKPKPWTPEWLAKIAAKRSLVGAKLRGRAVSDETRAKLRVAALRQHAAVRLGKMLDERVS